MPPRVATRPFPKLLWAILLYRPNYKTYGDTEEYRIFAGTGQRLAIMFVVTERSQYRPVSPTSCNGTGQRSVLHRPITTQRNKCRIHSLTVKHRYSTQFLDLCAFKGSYILRSRASISQDYWGGHKRRPGCAWGPQRRSPGRASGDEVPQKLKLFFVKLHIIFALKYNRQQLLSLESTS